MSNIYQEYVVDQHIKLMTSLSNLPGEIASAQGELTEAKEDAALSKRNMEDVESNTRLNIDGKNAEERAAKLVQALGVNPVYRTYQQQYTERTRYVARLTNDVDNLTRQFTAVGFMARLHAGLMAYLAASGAVMPEVSFGMGVPVLDNGNGYATKEDAEALGL